MTFSHTPSSQPLQPASQTPAKQPAQETHSAPSSAHSPPQTCDLVDHPPLHHSAASSSAVMATKFLSRHHRPSGSDLAQSKPSSPPTCVADALQPKQSKESLGWDEPGDIDPFGTYMQHKNRKLREQFNAEFHDSQTESSLFAGVVVWVDGHTNPSRLAIRRIMGQHGGRLETYYSRLVTHVVATQLATATRLRFEKDVDFGRRLKLVSPKWITACIRKKRRVSESDFPVPHMRDPTQRSISSMFKSKSRKKDAK